MLFRSWGIIKCMFLGVEADKCIRLLDLGAGLCIGGGADDIMNILSGFCRNIFS